MSWLSKALWLVPFCVAACDTFESTPVDAGDHDAGGGSGGSMDAALDAPGGDGGSAGTSGTAGAGGNGGEPPRWIASKTTLDVWWPWTSVSDPGRGPVEIISLTRVDGACGDASVAATLRICGVQVPTRTVDFRCEANALQIPDEVWDAPDMPTFPLAYEQPDQTDAGESPLSGNVARIGIASDQPDGGACDGDAATQCYPDHDDDDHPGLSVTYRNDLATYVGPYDSGECSWPRPYAYRRVTIEYVCAGGICGPQPTIATERIGVVASLPSLSQLCASAPTVHHTVFQIHSAGCTVDLDTVANPTDPRIANMDDECIASEIDFVSTAMPAYRVLDMGESPPSTPPCPGCPTVPYGWMRIDRDIDRTPSEGTKIDSMELQGSAMPTCAQARAAFANE